MVSIDDTDEILECKIIQTYATIALLVTSDEKYKHIEYQKITGTRIKFHNENNLVI